MSAPSFDFDTPVDRRHTGSLKWDRYPDALPLWVADMDFRSAPAILEALQQRLDHGVMGYTIPYTEVVEEVLSYQQRMYQSEVDPDWLFWLPGLVQGLNLACLATGEPGDAVMTCTPIYPPFLSAPVFAGRRRITVPLTEHGNRWTFDFQAMEEAVTPHTRLFLLCNPHNPVGRVYTREELEQLVAFCLRHDLVLCSDEVHAGLIFDERAHVPGLSLGEDITRRLIVLNSPSKTFNQPGLACAYAIIPNPDLRKAYRRAARGVITEVNLFGFTACVAAYRDGEPWRQALLQYLRSNRNLLYEVVERNLPGLRMLPMEATYLAWMDARELGLDQPARFFAERGVGLSDGVDFGFPGWLRLNFGCTRALLEDGLSRMVQALKHG